MVQYIFCRQKYLFFVILNVITNQIFCEYFSKHMRYKQVISKSFGDRWIMQIMKLELNHQMRLMGRKDKIQVKTYKTMFYSIMVHDYLVPRNNWYF